MEIEEEEYEHTMTNEIAVLDLLTKKGLKMANLLKKLKIMGIKKSHAEAAIATQLRLGNIISYRDTLELTAYLKRIRNNV